jgi:glycerophosphoryl diester phosphodiesterase
VLFHDPDAWRLCASPVQIGRSTHAELARLQIGGHSIPTLESLLKLVGGRVPLLLEVKVQSDIWRWMPALATALAGYSGRFGVMSFDPRIPRLLKTNMPGVRRGLVLEAALPPLRRRVALALAAPEFIAVEQPVLAQPWVEALRRKMPVYGWTICSSAERVQAQVHADALIWEADGRP